MWLPPSQIMKAALRLYLHFPLCPLASASIPLFSSADHGRLISICFAVISHNSSIAVVVPAYRAGLPPAPAPFSLPAGAGSRLWSPRTPTVLVEGFSLSRVQTARLCCRYTVSQTLCRLLCPPPECSGFLYTFCLSFKCVLTPRCHAPLPNDSESN